jgi:hypothetical protein
MRDRLRLLLPEEVMVAATEIEQGIAKVVVSLAKIRDALAGKGAPQDEAVETEAGAQAEQAAS